MENIREAASAVYESSEHKGDNAARQQAVDLLNEPDVKGNLTAVTQQLESTGTLPQLVISEFDRLDGDGNGNLTWDELQKASTGGSADALTKMAADYAIKRWDNITDSDDIPGLNWLPDNEISKDEINKFRDSQRASRVAEPSEMYKADRVINNETSENELQTLLTRNASSPEQQLKAIESLLAQGKKSFEMTDLDGNKYTVSINVQKDRGVEYISLQANDDGSTYPLLRAVNRNGVYEQQTRDGQPVSWYGTQWQQLHPGSAFAM